MDLTAAEFKPSTHEQKEGVNRNQHFRLMLKLVSFDGALDEDSELAHADRTQLTTKPERRNGAFLSMSLQTA